MITYLNREGSSQPANIYIRALGDISPGRPLNFARDRSSSLEDHISIGYFTKPKGLVHLPLRLSHFFTSSQASSFKKL